MLCLGPMVSAHERSLDLPVGGHQNRPLMASGIAQWFSWSLASLLCLGLLRARAGRSGGWAPAVGPFDEFYGDNEGDGECDLVESVVDEAVGVAA